MSQNTSNNNGQAQNNNNQNPGFFRRNKEVIIGITVGSIVSIATTAALMYFGILGGRSVAEAAATVAETVADTATEA